MPPSLRAQGTAPGSIEALTDDELVALERLLDPEHQRAELLADFRRSRTRFGVARMELGARLHLAREHRLWEGVAESWESFLAAENINPNAARQYMTVARKFVLELQLPAPVLERLCAAGITALERAARAMTPDNQAKMVALLSVLPEGDAVQRIIELGAREAPSGESGAAELRVVRLVREYMQLPPDLQGRFRDRIAQRRAATARGEGAGVGRESHPDSERSAKASRWAHAPRPAARLARS